MTNYHKLFLDSTYRAPPYQEAKPFFTLFNSSNYWLQAVLVIAVFLILNMMPFMRDAAHMAGGHSCPSLFGMLKDALVCKEEVHDIINQTPEGYKEDGDSGSDEESDASVSFKRQHRTVRQARVPQCPQSLSQDMGKQRVATNSKLNKKQTNFSKNNNSKTESTSSGACGRQNRLQNSQY